MFWLKKLWKGIKVSGLVVISTSVWSQEYYSIADLGQLGDLSSCRAYGLNDEGIVVGYCSTTVSDVTPVMWRSGRAVQLAYGGVAYAVNKSKAVAGSGQMSDSTEVGAFVWRRGSFELLPGDPLVDESRSTYALSINRSGVAVGITFYPNVDSYGIASMWTAAGAHVKLPPILGGRNSRANSINDHGRIVGESVVPVGGMNYYPRATQWTNSLPIDLGLYGSDQYSVANDISESNVIVGSGDSGALYWIGKRGPFLLSGSFGCSAVGISNDSSIVANCQDGPVLYRGGVKSRLNDLLSPDDKIAWNPVRVSAINSSGQIVGWGRSQQGGERAFLMTPPTK